MIDIVLMLVGLLFRSMWSISQWLTLALEATTNIWEQVVLFINEYGMFAPL